MPATASARNETLRTLTFSALADLTRQQVRAMPSARASERSRRQSLSVMALAGNGAHLSSF